MSKHLSSPNGCHPDCPAFEEEENNAGCDKCGTNDRVAGSEFCEHCLKFDPDKDVDNVGRTNGQRAENGQRALDYWRRHERPDEADLTDLLADLMHMAHRDGINFEQELERAQRNFEVER